MEKDYTGLISFILAVAIIVWALLGTYQIAYQNGIHIGHEEMSKWYESNKPN